MKFILPFLMTFSSVAYAYEGFRCIPSLRDTRLQVLVQDENIELRVTNAFGYKFMPQFSNGSVFNLAFFKMQGQDLEGLGDVFSFSWPREKCELDSKNFILNCQGEAITKVNEITSYGISTTEITEKLQDKKYEKRRFRISTLKDNLYFVNLEFYTQNCEKF